MGETSKVSSTTFCIIARISAGKQRVTVVPFIAGVRDAVVEAALADIVDGLGRSGRIQVAMGDPRLVRIRHRPGRIVDPSR